MKAAILGLILLTNKFELMRNNIMQVKANTRSGALVFDNAKLLQSPDSYVIDIITPRNKNNEVHTFRLKGDKINSTTPPSEIIDKFYDGKKIKSFHSVFIAIEDINYEPKKGLVNLRKIS